MSQTASNNLEWTPEIERETAHLYNRVAKIIPPIEWPFYAPYVYEINRLKKQRNAVILAHNYQTAEIYGCVADLVGDSLQLAIWAKETNADIIVQAGVYFMAETSKILCPDKKVLIPDPLAGCSLADAINAKDVRQLKKDNPGVPVVCYVNTSAEVKAESDICCTSSNVVDVVKSLKSKRVFVIPDKYLADYTASELAKQKYECEILSWNGACEVHERFDKNEIRALRESFPDASVLAHPECPADVLNEADYTGSTSQMSKWIHQRKPQKAILITECSMADNIALEVPETELLRPCNLCPHMKRITLPKIVEALRNDTFEITVEPDIRQRAVRAIDRMIDASGAQKQST